MSEARVVVRPVVQELAFDLIVVTDPSAPRGLAPYLEALACEIAGWALIVRDHEADDASLARSLERFQRASRGTPILLACATLARVELAARLGAGVHLPERGPSVSEARSITGTRVIGASVHDLEGARRRAEEGADLLVLAPFGAVAGKGAPLTDERVRDIVGALGSMPVFALGGIRHAREVERALDLGCHGVAFRAPMASATDGARGLAELRALIVRGERDHRAGS